jgi:hypothetical protein
MILSNSGQNHERSVARDDAMKNYSWYSNYIFYLSKRYNYLEEGIGFTAAILYFSQIRLWLKQKKPNDCFITVTC